MSALIYTHRLSITVLVLLCTATVAEAQVSPIQRDAIVNSLRDAASNLDLDRVDEVDAAKERVVQRAEDLVAFVNRASSGKRREGWMEYLDLHPLQEAISGDESVAKTYREAVALQQRLFGTAPGLEFKAFRSLRDAVDRLIPALKYSRKERLTPLLSKKIESDAEEISEMELIPTPEESSTANRLMALLSETNQTSYASDVLRQNFGHPNIAVWVGEGVVQRVVSRPVHKTTPVIDCILGTSINGKATLTGNVSADVFPMQGAVGLNVSLAGNVVSRNRGYHKPVSLITSSYGNVLSSRTLYISEAGIAMEPTYTQATVRTEINQINHRFRFVRRIARRKAAESKPQTDRIALDKLRSKVGEQFSDETAKAGSVQIPDVMEKARPVLRRLDIPEPARMIGSTHEGQLLMALVNELAPAIALNLHDQCAYYQCGDSGFPSTLAFLAPPFDKEKSESQSRLLAMQLIGQLVECAQTHIKGKIAQYDDTFSPRCFGDQIAAKDISTILIESGAHQRDPNRQIARALNTKCILEVLNQCSQNKALSVSHEEHITTYKNLPFNQEKKVCSLLINNLRFSGNYQADVSIVQTRRHSAEFIINSVGDLSGVAGLETLDATGYRYQSGNPYLLRDELVIDNRSYLTLLEKGYSHFVGDEFLLVNNSDYDLLINPRFFHTNRALILNTPAYGLLEREGKIDFALLNGKLINISKSKDPSHD